MNARETQPQPTPGAPQQLDVLAGEAVQRLRERAGLSRAALGAACGVSGAQIEKYETGINRMSLSRFHKLATVLGTTPDRLLAELVPAVAPSPALPPARRVRAAELALLAGRLEDDVVDHLLGLARALSR
ncbi:helix-turn-helix domain-containing protein [Parvularcula dongshanensis]|uniref:Transcriptional regulator with XRE-family HTH domain n=1 Tax=Parvularcula dongshanensis TaxID=1173995 RepID=A0A840I3I2_9PROT|nr:transcriptional regulator with XRE-family HTH domain [Parvularcula dongshanensis]